ncbi:MAG: ABC transporter permease [Acidobacteriaceae bacterium]|nr:ABC transporter permease [Acidobacteriaceae bacterium]
MRVPSLTTISILTVALGVGACTSLFSVVKAVLFNALPYPEPGRLTWLAEVNDNGRQIQVAYRNFLDWREQSHSFVSMTAFADFPVIVAGGELARSTRGALADESFFKTLGVSAHLGRTFADDEVKPGVAPVAVIGYGLWQRAFGGSHEVIGRRLRMSGVAATVIGVMPAGFGWPEKTEIWLPNTAVDNPANEGRTGHNWRVVGRLRPGSTVAQAQAEVGAIERRIKQQFPSPFQAKDAAVVTLQDHVVGQVRPALLMLFGAVGFLLLIVCVNVANLLLVRVTARSRELAVRRALGAGRGHLIRQMLTESMLLGSAGGAGGLLLASLAMELLRVLLPPEVPRFSEIRIDAGVLAFALAVSAAAGLLFGCVPAWRACAMNVNDALKSGSRSATATVASERTQSALVVSEVCLALVLVAGAALLVRSFWNLHLIDPGFRPERVLVAETSFSLGEMPAMLAQYRELLARVGEIRGVEAVGMASVLPITGFHPDGHFQMEGRPELSKSADADYVAVSPGYLSAMRIPLLRGRDFNDRDSENNQHVAVINQAMARVYFRGADPIGRRIWFDSFNNKENWVTIVGVAGDTRQSSLTRSADPAAYVLYTQQTYPGLLAGGNLVVRTSGDPASVAGVVRAAIRAANPDSAPTPRTMVSILAESLARQRFQMEVLGAFAVLSLLLAAVGLYGVLSYVVTASRTQIGIRLALGARPAVLFRMITGRALALSAAGAALGTVGCAAVRKILASLLFGIGPSDPATIAGAVCALMLVAFAAAFFPALRAMRVDPMTALREE